MPSGLDIHFGNWIEDSTVIKYLQVPSNMKIQETKLLLLPECLEHIIKIKEKKIQRSNMQNSTPALQIPKGLTSQLMCS